MDKQTVDSRQLALPVSETGQQNTTTQLRVYSKPELAQELKTLLLKLQMARGVDVPADRYAFFLGMLADDRYTVEQLRSAERWILRGNWQYKGTKPVLELSDFYPTAKQLAELANTSAGLLLSQEEFAAQLRRSYNKGKEAAHKEYVDKEKDTQAYVDLVAFTKEYSAKLYELRQELEKAQQELQTSEYRHIRQHNRLSFLEQLLTESEDKTAADVWAEYVGQFGAGKHG